MKSLQTASCIKTPVFPIAVATCLALGVTQNVHAVVSYSTIGSVYTEDFNSLPTDMPSNASIQSVYTSGWTDDSTTIAGTQVSLNGWYLYHPLVLTPEGGANTHQRLRNGTGANTGSFWAFGNSASNPEKALGSIGSATTANDGANMYMAMRLVNNTGTTLTDFTLIYDGEQWRDGQSASGETLSFGYSLTASLADWNTTATFNSIGSLSFTSPVVAGTGTSGNVVDGNVAGKVADITGSASGFLWEPGAELWLRWADPQLASLADDGLAIDNVRFSATAVPEPSTFVLAGMGAAALLIFRRRK